MYMASFATIYALLWTALLIVAPIACAYGVIKTSAPLIRARSFGVAALGFLLSALLAFSLATTVLQPLALLVLPAILVFSYAIFKPSIFSRRGIRAYLVFCMAASALFSIWICWATFMRT